METILPYVLSLFLVLVPLSLYLLTFIRNCFNARNKHPPGSIGWPLLGENIEFALLGPRRFIQNRMEKYSSEVFQTSLLGEKVAVFCGAQASKFLFMNDNKLVTKWLPQSIKKVLGNIPELMERNEKDVGGPTQSVRHDIFKLEAIKEQMQVMDALAREHLDNYWSTPNKVVKVYPMMRKYTFEISCKFLLNVVDPEQIKKLSDPFNLLNEAISSIPIDFPGTAYNRGLKGSKQVREELIRIIKERRKEIIIMQQSKEIINSTDVLSRMLLQGDESFGDKEICFNLIGLLLASYETTSNATTSVINYLAQLPHIYEEVFKEQMEIAKSKGPGELLTWQDIEKMKYSWNVVRESLRLTPPVLGAFREATSEFTYAGFTIPKGWKTFWTVYSSHMNSEYFPEPEKFDPSRFEGSGPAPYTFIPFGGGLRMCPGKEYARLQILIFIHNAVTRFKFEKAIPNEKFVSSTLLCRPVYGLPVHLHPHDI